MIETMVSANAVLSASAQGVYPLPKVWTLGRRRQRSDHSFVDGGVTASQLAGVTLSEEETRADRRHRSA